MNTQTITPDASLFDMVPVTKEQFYSVIGPRDIVLTAKGSSNGPYGIYVDFKTRSGEIVGKYFGRSANCNYMLTPEYAAEAK